ncbi:MAG: methyltransferase domain-containing protein [Candidatus Rokubacteria bacterium]|nr:methyltransferase domain-containing protein [Candidatus Rokubacteria bacterium]
MTADGPQSEQVVARPYLMLAPYFAKLFVPRGIRGWFRRGIQLVATAGVSGGWHLDVGAGTCRFSRYWTRAGFRTVCLDLLHEMLSRARLAGTHGRLHRVCGTIDCLRASETFDLVTAIDDVVGYVGAQPGGLEGFLQRLAPRVRRGGVFLLDFMTPRGRNRYTFRSVRQLPAGEIVADSRGLFDERSRVLSVDLTFTAPDCVARERHVLRLYSVEEMERLLRAGGFEVLAVTDLYAEDGLGYSANLPSYDLLARRL